MSTDTPPPADDEPLPPDWDDEEPFPEDAALDDPIAVSIGNEQSLLEIDPAFLEDVVRRTLSVEEVTAAEIGVLVVDDPAIHEINRRHLDHDFPTDVISFPLHDVDTLDVSSLPVPRGRGRSVEGEIVASAETAERCSADFDWSPTDELVLYLVHGLLHVVGYDDIDPAQRTLMRERERVVLREFGLEPRFREPGSEDTDVLDAAGREDGSGVET